MSIQQLMLGVGASKKTYIDDVFATQLYLGNDTSNTDITNGIDLAGEGGFVWIKNRDDSFGGHAVFDTVRGVGDMLRTNTTGAESYEGNTLTTFNSNGFRINSDNLVNKNNDDFTSWSFRKAPGFFDVVTYTGNGADDRAISHSLGSVPGMIIVKALNDSSPWTVYHREIEATKYLYLNDTQAVATDEWWADTTPTASNFYVQGTRTNANNTTFVAYVFAGGESNAATARSIGFNGVNTYLSIPDSTDFNLGTNSFTIEGWIYPNIGSMTSNHYGMICSQKSPDWYIAIRGGSGLNSIQFYDGTSAHNSAADSIPEGQWTHVAFVNNSGTGTWYINGKPSTSGDTVSAPNVPNSSGAFEIGTTNSSNYFNGDLSNLRIVKGTAVYTSAFIPPTKPLTNITNTVLLCCNNSSATGSTVTPGTITATGNEPTRTYSPFDDPDGFKFGDSKEGIIKCGNYAGNGDNTNGTKVYLGFEPQWVMIKSTSFSEHWHVFDSMRGMVTGGNDIRLEASAAGEETTTAEFLNINPDGFTALYNPNINKDNEDFIYIAIRRPDGYVGKPPELGTDVFTTAVRSSSTAPRYISNFPVDFALYRDPASTMDWFTTSRLTGPAVIKTNSTDEGTDNADYANFDHNNGFSNQGSSGHQTWMWSRRGQGFDVVTYEGTQSVQDIKHSLNKAPEMMWMKNLDSDVYNWSVYHSGLGDNRFKLYLNTTADYSNDQAAWNNTAPTSTHFTLGTDATANHNGSSYIAMLFASVDGISKVGSYTGNNTSGSPNTQEITVGFQPRFIMIKKSDGTGDWRVLDSVRGWTAGSTVDPALKLNSNAEQDSGYNLIQAVGSTSFTLSDSGLVNANGAKFIYYAHA